MIVASFCWMPLLYRAQTLCHLCMDNGTVIQYHSSIGFKPSCLLTFDFSDTQLNRFCLTKHGDFIGRQLCIARYGLRNKSKSGGTLSASSFLENQGLVDTDDSSETESLSESTFEGCRTVLSTSTAYG